MKTNLTWKHENWAVTSAVTTGLTNGVTADVTSGFHLLDSLIINFIGNKTFFPNRPEFVTHSGPHKQTPKSLTNIKEFNAEFVFTF